MTPAYVYVLVVEDEMMMAAVSLDRLTGYAKRQYGARAEKWQVIDTHLDQPVCLDNVDLPTGSYIERVELLD